jgi:predicted glycosyltransferase
MKVLFAVYHPADFQVAYPLYQKILSGNGSARFVILEKENIIESMARDYRVEYRLIGSNRKSLIGKLSAGFIIPMRLRLEMIRQKTSLVFSPTAPYTSLSLILSKIPLVCWADTEIATTNLKYSAWRINALLLPHCFYRDLPYKNIIRYHGYKELAYLHPDVFTPDKTVLEILGVKKGTKLVLMRFSALKAVHDIGLSSEAEAGMDRILEFIHKIEKEYQAKVFISVTERSLDDRFRRYELSISPVLYTHLLSYCTLYFGEGTTTASEAGILGIPWINVQKTSRGYLIDQEEKYGLGYRYENLESAIEKAEELLSDDAVLERWNAKKQKIFSDKINVSEFFSWFIQNYPLSRNTIRENPDHSRLFL